MKESSFWSQIRDGFNGLPDHGKPFCHRIENSAGTGQPDVNIAYAGREVWLELKVYKGRQIEVRHSQFRWLRNRLAQDLNNTFIVARYKNEIHVWRGYSIYNCTSGGRATATSMIFVPPEPDYTWREGNSWTDFRNFLFR